jgi:uncharacterized protein (TIGR02145 family)
MKSIVCLALLLLTGNWSYGQNVYAALAVDRSEGSYIAWSYDYASLQGAEKRALRECAEKGGNCTVVLTWQGKGCGAYRTVSDKAGTAYGWGVAATREEADVIATAEALKRSKGVQPSVFIWACNSVGEFKSIRSEALPPVPAEIKPEVKPEIKKVTAIETAPLIREDKTPAVITVSRMQWMARNLDKNNFRNGDSIPIAKNDAEWIAATQAKQPVCRYLNDDRSNGEKFGLLYNWYAVNDPRGLAPSGFHVPTTEEWENLFSRLGDPSVVAGRLKSTSGWIYKGKSEMNGTDEFGFNAMPGGNAVSGGGFAGLGGVANFWSSSSKDDYTAFGVFLYSHKQSFGTPIGYPKTAGLSVRCVKD